MIQGKTIEDFGRALTALAGLCNAKISAELFEMYDLVLSPFGYDAACMAIAEAVAEMQLGDNNKMPTVSAIRRIIMGEPEPVQQTKADDSEARLAASSIIAACARYGSVVGTDEGAYAKLRAIKEFVGKLGWDLIERRGGWNFVCSSVTNDNMATLEAQFRELGKAIADRQRKGLEASAGDKPLTPPNPRALTPLSKIPNADLFGSHIGNILKRKEIDNGPDTRQK